MLEVIKPVATEATATMKELEATAQNLSHITDENSELNQALAQFKTFGEHLVDLTAPEGSFTIALKNVERISSDLAANHNLEVTLQNFRVSSDKLKSTMSDLEPVGHNITEFSETVKSQPWRLVWPSTKKSSGEIANTCARRNNHHGAQEHKGGRLAFRHERRASDNLKSFCEARLKEISRRPFRLRADRHPFCRELPQSSFETLDGLSVEVSFEDDRVHVAFSANRRRVAENFRDRVDRVLKIRFRLFLWFQTRQPH